MRDAVYMREIWQDRADTAERHLRCLVAEVSDDFPEVGVHSFYTWAEVIGLENLVARLEELGREDAREAAAEIDRARLDLEQASRLLRRWA